MYGGDRGARFWIPAWPAAALTICQIAFGVIPSPHTFPVGSLGERLDPRWPAADRLLARGAKNVLLKLGSRGCVIAQATLPKERVPAFSVNAVDTTAAGDAFNAGFAVGMLRGYSTLRSAALASAVAAISVTRPGAQPSMPTGDEVERFLEQQSVATTTLSS